MVLPPNIPAQTHDGRPAFLKRASTPGYWNLWPRGAGNAYAVHMMPHEAARRALDPDHARAIHDAPDSSD